jgi:hypothetical protein
VYEIKKYVCGPHKALECAAASHDYCEHGGPSHVTMKFLAPFATGNLAMDISVGAGDEMHDKCTTADHPAGSGAAGSINAKPDNHGGASQREVRPTAGSGWITVKRKRPHDSGAV